MEHPIFFIDAILSAMGVEHAGAYSHITYTWLVMLILIASAFFLARKVKLVPQGGQNFFEVLIDGRPHGLASRGRRIYADLVLRLTLRRALRMTWFPVFVDDAQCWSGGWPETREPTRAGGMKQTPVIYLHAADVDLDVKEGSP